MINDALIFLKNSLNHYLNSGLPPDDPKEDQVVFLDGQSMEPLTFKLGTVSILLINVEEENTLRPPDPYLRSVDGKSQKVYPEIKLNLYVLFAAHYRQYEDSLYYLSLIIRYFQNHRTFNHHDAPELSEEIDQLILELITLPFTQQNEVWNSLRVTYRPSVLYRVKMIVFQDQDGIEISTMKNKNIDILS